MNRKDILSIVIGFALMTFVYWLLFFALAPEKQPKILAGRPTENIME